jgi:hypothetical protein
VLLAAWTWNGSAARNVTVTITQYEAAGGSSSTVSVLQSVTPANVVNGLVNLGEITLPVKAMAQDNTDSYFTINVVSANSSDRFLDVVLLDTAGQTVYISLPGSGYTDYWIDAPDSDNKIGHVLGSIVTRSQAVSVLASTFMSGGSMRLLPGENIFMVYSPSGMPGLEGDYFPRWWNERLS